MTKSQTWGYRGPEAQLFDGPLPEGWSDRPARGYHPHDVERGVAPDPEPTAEAERKAAEAAAEAKAERKAAATQKRKG